MWNEILPQGSTWLPLSALGAIVAALVACVAAWRKWKSGEIEDDGILLQRAIAELGRKDTEIEYKRQRILAKDVEIDELRRRLRRAEDAGAIYRRELMAHDWPIPLIPREDSPQ